MKLELDENPGRRCRQILNEAGYDVTTVHEQGMAGCADDDI